ncbi:MAG: hypothetical protein CMJ95_14410 [Planctomycetes bacterium]|nr:hypothetical protein [Planctomycetota bacterium]
MLRIAHREKLVLFLAYMIFWIAVPANLPAQQTPGGIPKRVGDMVVPNPSLLPPTQAQVTAAIDLPAAQVNSVNFGTSDDAGIGIFAVPLGSFPTDGADYLVLSTGAASSVTLPNDMPNTSTVLDGLNTPFNNPEDLVQVTLVLDPPAWATCLAFDFKFYSEEFPEYVGSIFNDVFIAEYGQSDFQEVNAQVVAPYNFAYDTDGNVVSVNTVFGVTEGNAQGTTYDGATPLLTARTPLDNTNPITITLSIMDLGDSVFDSTVFIDNFRWLNIDCTAGANVDTDGDALLDDWEENGIDYNGDGIIDLDLPAMGADKDHKDIFVEIDYMVAPGAAGHTHRPSAAVLDIIIDTFANAPVTNPDGVDGITIHIDAGSTTIMNPTTGDTWGARSKSEALAHVGGLGSFGASGYDWSDFDTIKEDEFSVLRGDVFHYCIFAHGIGALATQTSSGISRGLPASDLIVSLGRWGTNPGTVNQQAGTFIHELGHNLGLKHGGNNHEHKKPNYLSVMNYSFQTNGLRIGGNDGHFDYSRFQLPNLDENNLDETVGISGVAEAANYGTRFWDALGTYNVINDINVGIDWSGDGDELDNPVVANLNRNTNNIGDPILSVLGNSDNWDEIVFNGGAIGSLGEDVILPLETEADEIDFEKDSEILVEYKVCITGPGVVQMAPGSTQLYTYVMSNVGESADSYSITVDSTEVNVAYSLGPIPGTLILLPGEQATVVVSVTSSATPSPAVVDTLEITLVSQANPNMLDQIVTETTVSTGEFLRADANSDNNVDIGDAIKILEYLFLVSQVDCLVSMDVNDDEGVDVADAINLLAILFNGGAIPPAPYPQCGNDPTPGPLDCNESGCP